MSKNKNGLKYEKEFTPSDEFLYSIWNFYELTLSARTRKNYYNIVKNYINTVKKDPLSLTREDVNIYYKYLEERIKDNRIAYSTALMRISVMRSLCEYIRHRYNAIGKEYINYFNEIILPDFDKTISDQLLPTEYELNSILEAAKNDNTAFTIFSLILKCGLTSSEICSLNTENILTDKNGSLCIQFPEKKKISRIIKLPQDISKLLITYIEENKRYNGFVFYNKHNTPLKVRDAERLLKKYIKLCLEKGTIRKEFTLQTLRHCALKYMMIGGCGEEEAAKYCGITTKWMSRYRKVVNDNSKLCSADMSVINIKNIANTKQ